MADATRFRRETAAIAARAGWRVTRNTEMVSASLRMFEDEAVPVLNSRRNS